MPGENGSVSPLLRRGTSHIPPREGVAYALVHFALMAFTLLGFYLQETDRDTPATLVSGPSPQHMPERELAVYAGNYLALLLPSELLQIILDHTDAWQANQDNVILVLRRCEGNTKIDAAGVAERGISRSPAFPRSASRLLRPCRPPWHGCTWP